MKNIKYINLVLISNLLLCNTITSMEKDIQSMQVSNNIETEQIKYLNLQVINLIQTKAKYKESLDLIMSLINKGADANSKDSRGLTPLLLAVHHNNLEMAEQLITKFSANINALDISGNSSLIYAVSNNNIEMVEFLIKHGCYLNSTNMSENNALIFAISRNSTDIATLLIKSGADINKINKKNLTPLSFAIILKNESLVKLLIDNGANIYHRPGYSSKYIYTYLFKSRNPSIIKAVKLKCISDIKAINYKKYKIYKELSLYQKKLNLYQVNINEKLKIALENDDIQSVIHLIALGADIDLQDKNGDTALIIAAKTGATHIAHILLACGANANLTNHFSNTALIIAAINNNPEILKLLISYKANTNHTNIFGNNALIESIGTGMYDTIIEPLFKCTYDINTQNIHGVNALMYAAQIGLKPLVESILARNIFNSPLTPIAANLNLKDKNGNNALVFALSCKTKDKINIVNLLVRVNGAENSFIDHNAKHALIFKNRRIG